MRRRHVLRQTLVLGLAAALGACSRSRAQFHGIDVSGADYGRDFRLQDPDGRTRTLADFRGQVVLLFFGFTQCPDVCPTALSRAAQVMALLGPEAARLQVIFVTVDPERDTPAVLREYTRAFHPSFLGLATDLAHTRETAQHFKAFYQKVPTGGSYTMDHTATTYAFDPAGRLRLAISHGEPAASVAADVRQLLGGA